MKIKILLFTGIFLLFFTANTNAQTNKLYGTFCSYSSSGYGSSSSYSSSEHITFDGKGHYQYNTESSYSGGGNGYYGGNGGYGGTYRVKGNKVIITSSDGEVFVAYVYYVQSSGEITELKYDGTMYAKSLCD
ncbi:MAG: hypothetical protein GXO80_00685 [Chlorobi bacterium]|nr:hypothetical protein [Chlorobiota bacterium]